MNRSQCPPVIGITCSDLDRGAIGAASPLARSTDASYLNGRYSQAVYVHGGLAVLLPTPPALYYNEYGQWAENVCRRLDGIILSGGADFNPLHGNLAAEAHLGRISPERDRWEMALIHAAFAAELPILAICRGMQVLTAVAGGVLWQDISSRTSLCHYQDAPAYEPIHLVRLLPHSQLRRAFGLDPSGPDAYIQVNSFHHQAVRFPAPGFVVAGIAGDGLIEAVEKADTPVPVWGVQWHPEGMMEHDPLQARLFENWMQEVQRCRQMRQEKPCLS